MARQKDWSAATQKRIAVTRSMLEAIKSLKMLGLADKVEASIRSSRLSEISISKNFRWLQVYNNATSNAIHGLAPALTLTAYAIKAKLSGSGYLDTNTAFTSIAIISLVTGPASSALLVIPHSAGAFGSLERIRKYLLEPSRQDQRLSIGLSDQGAEADTELAIVIESATIRPSPTAEPVLKDISIKVKSGWMVMVAGAVGTGKTSLIKAILGELAPDSGTIAISSRRIAFCSQSSWLPNDLIRNIVVGTNQQHAVNEKWYNKVIQACGLREDMEILPHGDQTLVGSRGMVLSGGQKQRVVSLDRLGQLLMKAF